MLGRVHPKNAALRANTNSQSSGAWQNQWHSPELGHPVPRRSLGAKGEERGTRGRPQSRAALLQLKGDPETRRAACYRPDGGTHRCARARCSGGRGPRAAAEAASRGL